MKHNLATLTLATIFLCMSIGARGQNDDPNIRLYYQQINKAELAIVDTQYRSALAHYDTAFQDKGPNGKDIYNAFLLSFYERDTLLADQYFSLLAVNGYKKTYFKDSILQSGFYAYVSRNYDSLYDVGKRSPKYELAQYLNRFEKKDQDIRKQEARDDNAIRAVDLQNRDSLVWFNNTYGFPGFVTVGFFEDEGNSAAFSGTFWMVMWHRRPISKEDRDMMLKEVKKGNFRPDDYSILVDDNAHRALYGSFLPKKGYNQNQRKEINRHRAEIYLESLEDFEKKLTYSFKRKDFVFYNIFYKPFNEHLQDRTK